MLDEYFDCKLGRLEYRSLRFDTKVLDMENFQGNAVFNYTGDEVDYTRVIEHKHFDNTKSDKTVVTYEYPDDWTEEKEVYYVINDDRNNRIKELQTDLKNDSSLDMIDNYWISEVCMFDPPVQFIRRRNQG